MSAGEVPHLLIRGGSYWHECEVAARRDLIRTEYAHCELFNF
jgi:hypothetical protein